MPLSTHLTKIVDLAFEAVDRVDPETARKLYYAADQILSERREDGDVRIMSEVITSIAAKHGMSVA